MGDLPAEARRGHWVSRTGVYRQSGTESHVCRELNPGPMEEKIVFLTTTLFLQPFHHSLKGIVQVYGIDCHFLLA